MSRLAGERTLPIHAAIRPMTPYPLLTSDLLEEPLQLPRGGKGFLVGRSKDSDLVLTERSCSREQLRISERAGGFVLEALSKTVPTLVNGQGVQGECLLQHGARIEFATFVLSFLEHPDSAELTAPTGSGVRAAPLDTLVLEDEPAAEGGAPAPALGPATFPNRAGIIGRGGEVEHCLDHPQISRRHASLQRSEGRTTIQDLGSANGTFVNGARIQRPTELLSGDRIDIGPYSLVFRGDSFTRSSRAGNARIVAAGLGQTVRGHEGSSLRILSEVALVVEPQELLAIIGPTGAGKSTLMRALCARRPAQQGHVSINGVDLYANFESLKRGLAYVSQHEVLPEELTVREAVRFSARLRLPIDTPLTDIERAVGSAIARVDLQREAGTLIGDVSGGQRKRASLACELASEPDLLFVDEVTSGLDDQADWEMMRLLRRSAERGMTVVCVTHNLANVASFCHKIAVMTRPGVLAFSGSPQQALDYFEVPRLADIYGKLARHEGAHWHERFRCDEIWRRDLAPHLARPAAPASAPSAEQRPSLALWSRTVWHQFRVLLERYALTLWRDRRGLALAGAQSLFVGLAISLAFIGAEGAYRELARFLLAVSCLWFGCSSASKELVKERRAYRQERDVNLHISSYLASKLVGLGALGCAQALLLCAVSAFGPAQLGLAHLALMLASVLVGCGMGLTISAIARTQDQATSAVPIALIPQIVLSGALLPSFHALPDLVGRLFVTGYWIQEGVAAQAGDNPLQGALWMLFLHFALYLAGAWMALRQLDRRGSGRPGARGREFWL